MWAVSSGEYSDYRVSFLCETEADANATIEKLGWGDAGFFTEEFVVCDASVEQTEHLEMMVQVWDDGTTTDEQSWTEDKWPWYPNARAACAWRWVRAPVHKGKGGRLEAWGYDHERVRKVFSEKRARLLADPAFRAQDEATGAHPAGT